MNSELDCVREEIAKLHAEHKHDTDPVVIEFGPYTYETGIIEGLRLALERVDAAIEMEQITDELPRVAGTAPPYEEIEISVVVNTDINCETCGQTVQHWDDQWHCGCGDFTALCENCSQPYHYNAHYTAVVCSDCYQRACDKD